VKAIGNKLRVGLVGTGFGTHVHLPAFGRCDDVEVMAVCSAQRPRAEAAARRFDVPFFTDDYRELVDRTDVDLVDVCTPPTSHHEITMAALAANKHVLCEKPFAIDAGQAEAMRDKALESGVVHAVNHEMRYQPVRVLLRRLVADGYIGRVQLVIANVVAGHGTDPTKEPYYWGWVAQADQGGGFVNSLLSHHLDLVRFCFGEITGVHGGTATLIRERPVLAFEYRDGDPIGPDSPTVGMRAVDADDTAVLTGLVAGDGVLAVSGTWSVRHPEGITLDAYGDEGTLHLRDDGHLFGARREDPELRELLPDFTLMEVPGHRLTGPFIALTQELVAAVAGKSAPRDRLFATFDDGLRLQQIIDAIRHPVGQPEPSTSVGSR
jgi:predicted dehydrogenase